MSVMVTPTEDDVLTILRTFILSIVPAGVEVIQGQVNRVPEPLGDDFIVMTPVNRNRLSTNVGSWDRTGPDPTEITAAYNTEFMCQLDLHGPNASDYGSTLSTLFRDEYACDLMAGTGVQPLYATDGKQMPFINAESQYEDRWVLTVSLQITPAVSTPMQFADTLDVTISSALGGV